MSELAAVPAEAQVDSNASPKEQYLQRNAARMESEYADPNAAPVEDLDTDDGIPDDAMESEVEDDGSLAITDEDDDELDTDEDGTPDDEESEEGGYEQRFKDTQAALTETSQKLSDLKSEYSERVGALTQQQFDIEDSRQTTENEASAFASMLNHNLQQLQQVNVQQLSQEQYANWQQTVNTETQKANYVQQFIAHTQQKSKEAKDKTLKEIVAVSRADLEVSIDNFNEVYPEIGRFAVDSGVSPKAWSEITDPGLIKILHRAMRLSAEPDAIETVVTKNKAKKQQTRNLRARDEGGRYKQADQAFRNAKTPKDRRAAYLNREQSRMDREYRR